MSDIADLGPYDIAAEQAVLGSMMLSAAAAHECLSSLTDADFARPAHQIAFAAIRGCVRGGEPADAVTILARLQESGEIGQAGGAPYLHTLIEAVPLAANFAYYARTVRDRAVRRRLLEAGRRITDLATSAAEDAHGLTERAVREVEAVRDSGQADDITTPTIAEFMAVPEEDDEYDWVVPGLLERGDRLVLTGTEGAGKSTLFRQLAVTIAAGLHPFTQAPIQPRRVLIIDCENGPAHTRRKLRPLILQAAAEGYPVKDTNMWLEIHPEGLDLARDKDVSWLLRRVAAISPDVVLLGPLYRLAPRALNDDSDAAPVIATLNMIRERGACVLLEAHAGHALGMGGRRDLRPRGSSAFLGWPEFGYGIRSSDVGEAKKHRVVDMVPWRGDRDEREWPDRLEAGGTWPWSSYIAGYDVDAWSPASALGGAA
ncbi:MAG TPA: DnaB-like helicase N-terminal domain-containing protein [Trebonia sp.]|nr:DnaB-like helicase N-terminal domain-containing protein [Trebonia sp.]